MSNFVTCDFRSDSLLRREACLQARVSLFNWLVEDFNLISFPSKIHVFAYRNCFASCICKGIWSTTHWTPGYLEESNCHLEPSCIQRVSQPSTITDIVPMPSYDVSFILTYLFKNLFNRKANNLFEKNAAPILHLAGMEVKIVKVGYSYFCLSISHLLKFAK